MARYEFLLISQNFQHPRQFELVSSGRLTGVKLASLLQSSFPDEHWYVEQENLESIGTLASDQRLVLSDIPRIPAKSLAASSTLKLYVLSGPDAGAWISITHGEQSIGRNAPLWLEDPLISRGHATLSVSARRIRLLATANHQLIRDDGTACSSIDLSLGSRFRLGNTDFAVGDPLVSESRTRILADDLEVLLPPRPEMSRLVMLTLAALVPVLTGILLAILMGTMLFLIISGVSALMGLVPACQIVAELNRWNRSLAAQRSAVVEARSRYAPPLGHAIVAGLDATTLGINSLTAPPLVWGNGQWSPQISAPSQPQRSHKAWPILRKKKLDAPWPGPVFAPATPVVWQLVGIQGQDMGEILAGALARFLPLIAAGRLSLVIDPSIHCLPASLLLLQNVTATNLTPPSSDQNSWKHDNPALKTIYLTTSPTGPIPDTLVIELGPALHETAEHWIMLDSLASHLPDQRFSLTELQKLSLTRFDRTVQRFLALSPSSNSDSLRPFKEPGDRLLASIGVSKSGDEVSVDFDADGPHMLICGTTGSGKSEALRRIVADLSYQFSPQQLAFALIDFKGGAGLSVYEQLPHVQLFSSDLDDSCAQRTLEQLEFEVRRREKLLADNGCSDLGEYRLLTSPPQPLPRLVVIVDEFRVFIETLPTAGQRIDRLAAVGRALGIHLILSTQRPAGTLTGQTRANINAVIALRVNDPSESVELVGSTAATLLDRPGLAIIKSSARPTEHFQFHLAAEPEIKGEILERNRTNMSLSKFATFAPAPAIPGRDPLTELVDLVNACWGSAPTCNSGFAPPLPPGVDDVPMPTSWKGRNEGAIFCGVRDNLAGGTQEPLIINTQRWRSLLICGLPEAGARLAFEYFASLSRKILCFGPSPVQHAWRFGNLKVVTGEDTYAFLDALDFLEAQPNDESLIIMIHSLAQLQSSLPPQHFQRFDEAVGSLLRLGGSRGPFIVCAVDRDQNCLKSTGLFTTQWYFPLNATEPLKMIWPKLPACSPIPGRGVVLNSDHSAQVFQLAPARAEHHKDCTWIDTSAMLRAESSPFGDEVELLGYHPFTGSPVVLPHQARFLIICADAKERLTISSCLAKRWKAAHSNGIESLAATLDDYDSERQIRPHLMCINVDSPSDPRLVAMLERLKASDVRLVLFAPPSARLAYELGLPSLAVDDREVAIVEAEHSQDMQPMQWPSLHQDPQRTSRPYWRAVVARYGQPRMVLVPREA